jgi:hypothetical protein
LRVVFFFFLALHAHYFSAQEDTKKLDELIHNWHKAASDAQFDSYFKCLSDDFIFLGTAPGERWTKKEFQGFSKPFFDRGKAWDFIASNRIWNFSKDGKTAWFDEDLATWMEGCRGSGICTKIRGTWSISYYNLTVLIENEKIKEFIELRKN